MIIDLGIRAIMSITYPLVLQMSEAVLFDLFFISNDDRSYFRSSKAVKWHVFAIKVSFKCQNNFEGVINYSHENFV